MALSQASLSAKIEAELIAANGAPADPEMLKSFCDAIAKAVVDEITANAVVLPTALVAPPMGGAVTGTGMVS